jgi:hypothetical protein
MATNSELLERLGGNGTAGESIRTLLTPPLTAV